MAYTKILVVVAIIIAAVIIAAAPKGMSVLEMTATLNSMDTTQGELDTFMTLSASIPSGLDAMGRNTLIVPTDAAFDAYFTQRGTTLDEVLADPEEVERLVESHIIRGYRNSAGLEQPANIRTKAGTTIAMENGVLSLGETSAQVIRRDAYAGNGIVHVINGVLA